MDDLEKARGVGISERKVYALDGGLKSRHQDSGRRAKD